MIQTIILFGLIFVIFYFMIIRPQQKRQKERQKMLDAVQKGDKIITSGGIHGTVIGIEEKTVLGTDCRQCESEGRSHCSGGGFDRTEARRENEVNRFSRIAC